MKPRIFIDAFNALCDSISDLNLSRKTRKSKWSILGEGAKNTHLEHIEDELINQGAAGVERSLDLFEELLVTMAGHTPTPIDITTKWDGAPAIFAGTDPMDGKFFVGTKGVFARDSKMNKSLEDIKINHGDQTKGGEFIDKSDLRKKLSIALNSLKDLKIDGYVLQGDMLFTKDSINTVDIEGESFISFTPNTITYAVPKRSALAETMLSTDIGIIFHTMYTGGPTIHDMTASFGFDASKLRESNKVWFDDATFKDVSGQINLTIEDQETIRVSIRECKNHFWQIKNMLGFLEKGDDYMGSLVADLKQHINSSIKDHHAFEDDSGIFADSFIQKFIHNTTKKIEALKTERGQTKKRNAMVKSVRFLTANANNISMMYDLYLKIVDIKAIFIDKLSTLKSMDSFLEQPDGSFVVTKPEGFVAVDHIGNAIKLVDRAEFSAANFGGIKSFGKETPTINESDSISFRDYYNDMSSDQESVDFAIVPGSFKPPHRGHYDMVKKYSEIADQVVVLISNPSEKSVRKTSSGSIISPEMAKKVFELYVGDLHNVSVQISSQPSPVGAAFHDIQNNAIYKDKSIILGASRKDDDWRRWASARKWVESQGLPVTVLDPERTAVEVTCDMNNPCSASAIRDNIDNMEILKRNIPPHVSADEVAALLS
jgi:cytidyltransferase-like protein